MFCSAPWTSVQIKNTGQFSYCCMSRDPMGNHLNDDNLVEGRQRIISGEVLPVCKEKCFDIEHLFSSQRHFLNKLYPISNTVKNTVSTESIQYIDLRMGNICNFTCLMCGERDSHLWAKANMKPNPYISWTIDKEKYNEILSFIRSCTNLKSISFAGGEPFYNKGQLFEIIDSLSRDVELKFISNMSFCDSEIIEKLNEFKKGRIHCSIDGVDRWIETQRVRSNWKEIKDNMETYAKLLHKDWILNLVPTFTVINLYGLKSLLFWFFHDFLNKRKNSVFSYTICTNPKHMSIYNIPVSIREKIVNEIQKENLDQYKEVQKLLLTIQKDIIFDATVRNDLIKYLSYVKRSLNFDVVDLIPELQAIVGNNIPEYAFYLPVDHKTRKKTISL